MVAPLHVRTISARFQAKLSSKARLPPCPSTLASYGTGLHATMPALPTLSFIRIHPLPAFALVARHLRAAEAQAEIRAHHRALQALCFRARRLCLQ